MPCCAASDDRHPRTNTATRSTADAGTPVRSMLAAFHCGYVTIRALAASASRAASAAEIAAWSSSCWLGPAELGHAGGDLGHLIGAADLGIAGVGPQPVDRPSLDLARREDLVHCGSSLCFEVGWCPGFGQVNLTKWLPQKNPESQSRDDLSDGYIVIYPTGFRVDSLATVPVASEMPCCAPPHTDQVGEEPCRGWQKR